MSGVGLLRLTDLSFQTLLGGAQPRAPRAAIGQFVGQLVAAAIAMAGVVGGVSQP